MKSLFAALFGLLALSSFAVAQTNANKPASSQSLNLNAKKFSLSTPEIRCYSIRRITLVDEAADGSQSSSQFYWALDRAKAALQLKLPHCLGDQGLNLLTKQIQSEIAAGGYSSIRVMRPEQDLHSGSLVLSVLVDNKGKNAKRTKSSKENANNATAARKVTASAYTDGFKPSVSNKNPSAMAQYEAALKKVKDRGDAIVVTANRNIDKEKVKTVRQSIVNGNKVEKSVQSEVQLVKNNATEQKKHSGKAVNTQLEKANSDKIAVKGQAGVKGAGSSAKGKWQADALLSIQNILAYNDKLQLEYSHSTKAKSIPNSKANRQLAASYEIPFGAWSLGLAHKDNALYREVYAGKDNYVAHFAKNKTSSLTLSYNLYEDEKRQTTISTSAWMRQSQTDYVGIQNEKYRLSGWEGAIAHREQLGDALLSGKVSYKQALSFKNKSEPEEQYRPKTISAELALKKPFEVMNEEFYVESTWKAQWSKKALDLDDQFVIGGIDTVRGFNGNQVAAGSKGWLGRNELGWNIQNNLYTLYTAVDIGKVSRDHNGNEKHPTLIGNVIGLKGQRKAFLYDLFIAKAISKPKGFNVPKYLVGANVSYRF